MRRNPFNPELYRVRIMVNTKLGDRERVMEDVSKIGEVHSVLVLFAEREQGAGERSEHPSYLHVRHFRKLSSNLKSEVHITKSMMM